MLLEASYFDLKEQANADKRSLSNYVLLILYKKYKAIFSQNIRKSNNIPMQLSLFDKRSVPLGIYGTFFPNHKEAVHRWYPYIEGFSSGFASSIFSEFASPNYRIYDPFAGTGTAITVAASNGMHAFYSEINPFMQLVIECKTTVLREVSNRISDLNKYFNALEQCSRDNSPTEDEAISYQNEAFGDRKYFIGKRLVEIIAIKRAISLVKTPHPALLCLARLALGSIAVASSEMRRAADLRRRTPKEQLSENYSVSDTFHEKLKQIQNDINEAYYNLPEVTCLSDSALTTPEHENYIDIMLTSPPYLNGTNYFRNTKLELWLTGYINHQKDLADFRAKAMAAGINNISKRGRMPEKIPIVEKYAKKLDTLAYDKRIPELVRRYFSDSKTWLKNVFQLLKPEGIAIVDIGDSCFAGIHIPTHDILNSIAEECNFINIERRHVRNRKSKNGTDLEQVLLFFKKTKIDKMVRKSADLGKDKYKQKATQFSNSLPHLEKPYASRNWGHGLHSLCSYQGKLKPAIAHFLVERFTSPGDKVLDPLAGSGTIPLESFLQGRIAFGNDLQELGFILTRAKTERGKTQDVLNLFNNMMDYVENEKDKQDLEKYADFGFNGSLSQYFHTETFKEILAARNYIKHNPCNNWNQAIVYSSIIHILHGNRPYALSRRSHPVTPFKPSGLIEYRAMKPRLIDKVKRTVSLSIPQNVISGKATQLPFSDLPYERDIDVVITSPPFFASTRFYIANWMRLWFAGWEPNDFSSRAKEFLEYEQMQSMDIYFKFYEKCAQWIRTGGKLIMHTGLNSKCNMKEELISRIIPEFELVYSFDENVKGREKFGIRDQGATTVHQYIFLRRK